MLNETLRLHVLVPVVLRLALAAVFIYHGLDKIVGKDKDWGTNWAERLRNAPRQVPEGVNDKIDSLVESKRITEKQAASLKSDLKAAYEITKLEGPANVIGFVGTQMAVAWGELLCGVTLLLGLLTRLSSLLMIVIQVGAIATVTWAKGFSSVGGAGYEYNLLIIAGCLALMLAGGGNLSMDRCLKNWRQRRAAQSTPQQTPTAAPLKV